VPFGASVVDRVFGVALAAVADDHPIASSRLREVVVAHQRGVHEAPGVDDIVYEWRRYFSGDPLLGRTDDAYVVTVPESVWAEFERAHDLDESTARALRAVHAETAEGLDAPPDRREGYAPIVLLRP